MENTSCNGSDGQAVSDVLISGCRTDMDTFRTVKIVLTTIALMVIFLCSIAGNTVVFLIFFKRPALLTISNRFILNMSVCNCLNTLFVMPFMFTSLISQGWIFGDTVCRGTGFLMNTTFAASTLTLVAISVDRYCAVAMPLHYTMRVTSKRSIVMIISVWSAAVVASLPPLVGWNRYVYQDDKASCTVLWTHGDQFDRYYTLYLVGVTFILPGIVIVWSYIAIFRSAKNNFERTRRHSIVPSNNIEEGTQTPLRDGRRRSSTAPILSRRLSQSSRLGGPLPWQKDEWKTALTSLLVVSTFMVCWLPYFIIIVLESVLSDATIIYPVLELVSILLAMSSCAINPFVYVFRSKLARQQLKIILGLRREHEDYESRRGSVCVAIKEGIIRQSSTESDLDEKNTYITGMTSNKSNTTLTSLVHVPSCSSMRS